MCEKVDGFAPANWRTIKSRVEDLDARSVALRRGDNARIEATKATPGHYVAARPLAVVQIDHTRVDVVVVDEETREPIGRPWITLAIERLIGTMMGAVHLSSADALDALAPCCGGVWHGLPRMSGTSETVTACAARSQPDALDMKEPWRPASGRGERRRRLRSNDVWWTREYNLPRSTERFMIKHHATAIG
jgi:hypothetical protein